MEPFKSCPHCGSYNISFSENGIICHNPNCSSNYCTVTYNNTSDNVIQNSERECYDSFECNDCGHKFYSLDFSPSCPYCESKNCIKVE
jgi:hypothetical protein